MDRRKRIIMITEVIGRVGKQVCMAEFLAVPINRLSRVVAIAMVERSEDL